MVIKKQYLIFLPAIFIVGFLLFFPATVRLVGTRVASYCVYPFLVAQHKVVVPLQGWWQKKEYQELALQLKNLQEERDALLAETIELKATRNYDEQIKELLEFKCNYSLNNGIVAQVLVKNFLSHEHSLLINKGSAAGIVPDMVAVYNNNLIGRVATVYPFYSKIILITDKSCNVASYCATTKTHGIYEGANSLQEARLTHVSHLQTLQVGDLILSSGDGLVFPQGFALGVISKFEVAGVAYNVAIKPLVDVSALSYCMLIQKGAEPIGCKANDSNGSLPASNA